MSRGSTTRRPETWVSLCNLMLKHRGISRSSAILRSDSPQSNNLGRITPSGELIPRERPNVKHAIAGYLRPPQSTPAPPLIINNFGQIRMVLPIFTDNCRHLGDDPVFIHF